MSEPEFERPGFSGEKADQKSTAQGIEPEVYPDEMKLEPLMRAEKLSAEIERFAGLSSELRDLLSGLSREIKISAEQLNRIRTAVDLKKNELKTLYGIGASVAEIERLTQEHRQKKESFDRVIENQRVLWEEETAKRAQEQKDYTENLGIRREREEEEYRQQWAAEKLKARQLLDEELKSIQQEALEKQQAMERDCLARELALKEKELEWVQLIQQLEQFMSKLIRRTQTHAAAPSDSPAKADSLSFTEPRSLGSVKTENNPSSSFYFGENLSGASGEPEPAIGNTEPFAGSQNPGAVDNAISSLKDMLISQGRRIENLSSESPKKEPAPLIFLPKKPQS